MAWKVSSNSILKKDGESGVAGVFPKKTTGVKFVLEVFSNLFSEGLEYRTINGYRSTESAYHEKAWGIPIGQYSKVS